MTEALERTEPATVATITEIMSRLAEKGDVQGIETMARLWREEQDRAAAREFAHDFAEFQGSCPPVPKTSSSKPSGVTRQGASSFEFNYASLDEIAEHVRPHLKQHGFSYTWDCDVADNIVTATATLRHRNGHSITAKFSCPVDASTQMNAMQKVASARGYACRYAFLQVAGLTTGEVDESVRPENIETIDEAQIVVLKALLVDVGGQMPKLLDWLRRDRIEDLTEADYRRAVAELERQALAKREKK